MIIQYPNWMLPDLIRHILVLFMLVAGGKSAGLVPVAGPALSQKLKSVLGMIGQTTWVTLRTRQRARKLPGFDFSAFLGGVFMTYSGTNFDTTEHPTSTSFSLTLSLSLHAVCLLSYEFLLVLSF
ncbi:hypothetical protein CDAR_259331 [Caerostris darwini]|uniref:Uncharacterized protein n=1 Tax=Caerostris darwini TaxID=1538125 RepID=A0AAV4NBB0_9ARAC|nr:hypothetical protein CDAR_259331 [Caerostris darwini]